MSRDNRWPSQASKSFRLDPRNLSNMRHKLRTRFTQHGIRSYRLRHSPKWSRTESAFSGSSMTSHSRDHRLETPTKKNPAPAAQGAAAAATRGTSRGRRCAVNGSMFGPSLAIRLIPENRVQRVRPTGEEVNYVQDLRRTNLISRFLTQPPVTRVGYVGTPDSLGLLIAPT
jgi:hypothetical protein